ncbi:hypothetical protein LRS37_05990 [Neobacillus sedimentimangrovi]|jgi:hypothetical protein|uniref:Uncharacterized protein n=1 Tax=Neobacillus sedimentimangrovi TaxID=2699460 RepID=A0ABS8QGN3_9BACI|nr:hypothetical protein [Neobacillus sedimentimangrovi]MCD4838433.1 hypothetical protein [Neobacillus sedimentimangrovi]
MLLAYNDLANIVSKKQGVQGDFFFKTVTDMANVYQPKGLFIPINEESGELAEAITHGAIATIWDSERKLPSYTPNHFPVFFTNNLADTIARLLQCYIEKLNGETNKQMEITNFNFSNKKLLNKNNETYDIAVMLNKIKELQQNNTKRRG